VLSPRRSVAGAAGLALGAAAVGAGAVAWGAVVERNMFTVRSETVPVLRPGSRPVTVLHLSDLHLAPFQTAKQDWVRSLVHLEPDLVVSTGDLLGHEDAVASIAHTLAPFAGVPGVFVHGSNDYYAPVAKNPFTYFTGPSKQRVEPPKLDTAALEAVLRDELGWLDLNNAARAIELRGSRFEFFGVNDAHRKWDRLDRLPGNIEELRENVGWQDEEGPEPLTIGVTHAPYQRVLNSFVTHGAELIFAGHTHGGQVCVPGVGALVTNCDLPRDRASGLSVWNHALHSAYLNVSAGLGTSIYAPVRFACKPEAVLLTLTARP
jgi:predicted MPP superfamily phosphohydrolase